MKISRLLPVILFSSTLQASVTVSGISSGGYMAQQFHTAFSSEVSGVGIVAGGPYYCAQGQMLNALNKCMQTMLGMPQAKISLEAAENEARAARIDPVHNIASARVYIFSGTKDKTVVPKIAPVIVETYKGWKVPAENIKTEFKLNAGHTFPTDDFGNPCATESEPPFISNCGRDLAGEMLNHIMGPLEPKVPARANRLFSFPQLEGTHADIDRLSMYDKAYAYIPEGCENPDRAGCRVHIAFHGCKQTVADLKDTFMTKAGYNDWAEANKIVVFYPQAQKSMLINNPNGCWDWWGYSGADYHTKSGPQMERVYLVLQKLRQGKLNLSPARF